MQMGQMVKDPRLTSNAFLSITIRTKGQMVKDPRHHPPPRLRDPVRAVLQEGQLGGGAVLAPGHGAPNFIVALYNPLKTCDVPNCPYLESGKSPNLIGGDRKRVIFPGLTFSKRRPRREDGGATACLPNMV